MTLPGDNIAPRAYKLYTTHVRARIYETAPALSLEVYWNNPLRFDAYVW